MSTGVTGLGAGGSNAVLPDIVLSLSYKTGRSWATSIAVMTDTVNPIADGYHSITCFLAVGDANKAIDFYTAVFGAELLSRNDLPDGQPAHAELKIGDSTLQLGMPIPDNNVLAPNGEWVHTSIVHYCPDVDSVIARAIAHGARCAEEPQTFVTGDRFAVIIDPFGHRWAVLTKVEDVSREEADRRVNEWLATQ
ncbi:hypothetical protein O3I_012965 [Nocardia brasiliensis ATCC 700358]|uniref:VOC domain-containing protein n=2 Tax=Nocardia brasiliensis TaxID=37326 RepID=K0ETY2_NOCB7|nr:hypothetical protein O3I_012965 [Nocardia brasiliensis ATCC 700358]